MAPQTFVFAHWGFLSLSHTYMQLTEGREGETLDGCINWAVEMKSHSNNFEMLDCSAVYLYTIV